MHSRWGDASGPEGFSRSEIERYGRQLVLPEVGPTGQRKLKSSSVLVVGAGGLGVPAAVYLVAAGVGRIGIADSDRVERSNLHRQPIYSEPDIGKPKVAVASWKLREVNPNVAVVPYEVKLDSSNAMDILRDYDVVVDCSDNFPARYLINDVCVFLGKPDVYASVFGFDGQASVFKGDSGPCYRCLYPEPPPPGTVPDCSVAGVMGAVPGVMGCIQAGQTVNHLIGNGRSLVGRLLLFNGTDMTFDELRIKKSDGCPVCGKDPSIRAPIDYEEFCGEKRAADGSKDLTPVELKRLMESGEELLLLDVREPQEHEICSLTGAKLIPLEELGRRIGELDKRSNVVVYCHVGIRSATAVAFLASQGFEKVRNLKGGIKAWAEDVGGGIPVY